MKIHRYLETYLIILNMNNIIIILILVFSFYSCTVIYEEPNKVKDLNTASIESPKIMESTVTKQNLNFLLILPLLLLLLISAIKLSKYKNRNNKLKNEADLLKSQIDEIKKIQNSKDPDNFILIQIIYLIRNIDDYNKNIESKISEYFESIRFELDSIISNSGIKEFSPKKGESVLKDADLANKVIIKQKIKISNNSDEIGIITNILKKGYLDKNNNILVKAEIEVTS